MAAEPKAPSGHVFRVQSARGQVWYARLRLPDGRQVREKIGPAWNDRRKRPAGHLTQRLAEAWLRDVLEQAMRGKFRRPPRARMSFAEAAADWLRFVERTGRRKRSKLRRDRSILNAHLLPAFGTMAVEDVTTEVIEGWLAGLDVSERLRNKLLVQLEGILGRAKKRHAVRTNAAAEIQKFPLHRSGDIDVFSPEEIWELVRAAASDQDSALYLTAAFTGLRMGELLALRWCDVDFSGSLVRVRATYAGGVLASPKPERVRAVPMAPDVARALGRLAERPDWVGEEDLVFPGESGGYLDSAAVRRRYRAALSAAGLLPLRFRDLRHTFGTLMIAKTDIHRVQAWMGHADIETTMRYLRHAPRAQDAALAAEAFAVSDDLGRLGEPASGKRSKGLQIVASRRVSGDGAPS